MDLRQTENAFVEAGHSLRNEKQTNKITKDTVLSLDDKDFVFVCTNQRFFNSIKNYFQISSKLKYKQTWLSWKNARCKITAFPAI